MLRRTSTRLLPAFAALTTLATPLSVMASGLTVHSPEASSDIEPKSAAFVSLGLEADWRTAMTLCESRYQGTLPSPREVEEVRALDESPSWFWSSEIDTALAHYWNEDRGELRRSAKTANDIHVVCTLPQDNAGQSDRVEIDLSALPANSIAIGNRVLVIVADFSCSATRKLLEQSGGLLAELEHWEVMVVPWLPSTAPSPRRLREAAAFECLSSGDRHQSSVAAARLLIEAEDPAALCASSPDKAPYGGSQYRAAASSVAETLAVSATPTLAIASREPDGLIVSRIVRGAPPPQELATLLRD